MECKNYTVIRKTTKFFDITVKENGMVEDITGWTIYFTMKEKMGDTDANAIITKDITTHDDAINGKTVIELSTSDTDKPAGNYHYDIKYKDDDDNVGILAMGKIRIAETVTQRE